MTDLAPLEPENKGISNLYLKRAKFMRYMIQIKGGYTLIFSLLRLFTSKKLDLINRKYFIISYDNGSVLDEIKMTISVVLKMETWKQFNHAYI